MRGFAMVEVRDVPAKNARQHLLKESELFLALAQRPLLFVGYRINVRQRRGSAAGCLQGHLLLILR